MRLKIRRAIQIISLLGIIMAFCLCAVTSSAQQVEFSSTLNPVGSGSRATGMGGAFISVADDATAASWNPAGLVHLERPELSIVGAFFSRSQKYHSDVHPEIEGTNSFDVSGLNYASAAYPFVFLNRNMVVSLNYQRLYEMTKKVRFNLVRDIRGDKLSEDIVFEQKGHLYALSPAMAIQVSPQLYLGATLNLWGNTPGRNGWDNTYLSTATGSIFAQNLIEKVDWRNRISFKGTNAHLGLIWNVSGPFTIGAVYKTAFDGRLKKETSFVQSQYWTDLDQHYGSATSDYEEMTMRMPASYGVGLSYRHSDKWHVALDIYRTEWSRFCLRDSKGNEINPLDSRPIDEGRLKDTTQVRLGTEYLIIKDGYVVPVRAGLFYDPEPAKGSPDDFYGVSIGTGYSTKKFSVDASYQFRFGRRVTGDIPSVEGSSADIKQHTVMMSLIWYL